MNSRIYVITLQALDQPDISMNVMAEGIASAVVKVLDLIEALRRCTGDEYEIAEVKLYE